MEPDPGSAGVGKATKSIKQGQVLRAVSSPDTAFLRLYAIMVITLNGKKTDVPDGMSVEELLSFLNIQHERVAVELNEQIVKKAFYGNTLIKDGDSIEVVSFMGGGCNSDKYSKFKIQNSRFKIQDSKFKI